MSSIEQACGIIRKQLQSGRWKQGERLPPLSELAQLCFVSRNTMWKALGLLKKESLLSANQGGPIIAGPTDIPRTDLRPSRGRLWQQLTARLGRQLLSGAFTQRILPQTGKLAMQYGVDSRTLKKTLDALVQKGLLAVEGRRYAQVRGKTMLNRPVVFIISSAYFAKIPTMADPRTHSLVESFERECPRFEYCGRSENFNDRDPNCCIDIGALIKRTSNVAGIILNIWNPWDQTVRRRWLDLIQICAARKTPLILIDQKGDFPIPDVPLAKRFLRTLRCSDRMAGEIVADALLRRGHKRVAYVSAHPQSDFSKERYAGLRECIEHNGSDRSSVDFYALDKNVDWFDFRFALLNLCEKEVRLMLQNEFSEDELRDIVEGMKRVKKQKIAGKYSQGSIAGTLRHIANSMVVLAGRNHDSQAYMQLVHTLMQIASIRTQSLFLQSLFENVLKNCRATAWVCSEDLTAAAALSFLESKAVMVPDDISVVGFDNWFEAHSRSLSSFDFNMNGMIQEALLMIADEKYLKEKPAISEVYGSLVERASTRK